MKRKALHILLAAITAMMMMPQMVSAQKNLGGDISMLTKYEEKGATYFDANGNAITNVLTYLKSQGMNSMRVRLFVDPSQASETHKGEGVCQDLEYVKVLGKRIKDAGLKFLLDLHYSDTWTDPGQHSTPASWSESTDLATTLYDYTKSVLLELAAYGATPDFIQVGNEVNAGMLWESGHTWADKTDAAMNNFISYVKAGAKACRDVCPDAKIIFHVAMQYDNDNWDAKTWPQTLEDKGVDYDIIGLSYYPYYHGPLSQLDALLNYLEARFDKDIQIVEVGYPHAYYPTDNKYDYREVYPDSEAGQNRFTADLINQVLLNHKKVNGLYWWWPEANENGINWENRVTTSWYNMGIWDNETGKAQAALYTLQNFLSTDVKYTATDNTDKSYFAFDVDGENATIRKYNRGTGTGITVPATVTADNTNYNVTTIGASFGIAEPEATWIVLPSSVTAIGNNAFKDGYNSLELTFNSVPTTIGTGIFDNIKYPNAGITYFSLKSLSQKLADYTSVNFKTWDVELNKEWNNSNNISTAWVIGDMTVTRTLHKDYWNTIMLPVALSNDQLKAAFGEDMQLAELDGAADETLNFTAVPERSGMAAYTPYLLYPSKEMGTSFTLSGVQLESGDATVTITKDGYSFVGTLDGFEKKVPSGGYFLYENDVYMSTGNSNLNGMSGYFMAPSGASLARLSFGDDETAIVNVNSLKAEDSPIFRLDGQAVKGTLRKGVYIQKGKKIVVR